MTIPPYYEWLVIGLSAVLVVMHAMIVLRTAREYHERGPARMAWRLAARMAVLVTCVGLLISGLGLIVPVESSAHLVANFGLGIARAGLLAGGVALVAEGRTSRRSDNGDKEGRDGKT